MASDPAQEKSALFVATLTSFMGPFTISAVNVALPDIQENFSLDAVQLNWIATSFLLAVAITLVPMGRIADIHGRKKVFVWGLAIYTIASFFGAFSGSFDMLVVFRVVQGLGTAMFVTTGMAILTSVFPPHKRGRAIGAYVAAVYIGLSVGPLVGGILTQHLGWRSIFMVVVPFGAISVAITLKFLTGEWADARGESLDIVGCTLYSGAIFFIVYGASILPYREGIYLISVGVICLLAFVLQELRVFHPVFEVRLFAENKLFAFSSLAALINYGVFTVAPKVIWQISVPSSRPPTPASPFCESVRPRNSQNRPSFESLDDRG